VLHRHGEDGGVGEHAYGCTGGRQQERCKCFNLRLMWRSVFLVCWHQYLSLTFYTTTRREDGAGELYAYVPLNDANTAALQAVPHSHRNPDYGFSVGRGLWQFEPGRWTAVAQRVKMNTVGQADGGCLFIFCGQQLDERLVGEIEVFIDGQSVILAKGLLLRDTDAPESSVQGIHFQTFFGGESSAYYLLLFFFFFFWI
jgi:hypothetical protein